MARGELPHNPTTSTERRRLLEEARQAAARQRLSRLKDDGRIARVSGVQSPSDAARLATLRNETTPINSPHTTRRRRLDQVLFLIELLALVGLGVVAARLWQTNRELNADLAVIQRAQVAQIAQLQAQTQQTATAAGQAATAAGQATTAAGQATTAEAQATAPASLLEATTPMAAVVNVDAPVLTLSTPPVTTAVATPIISADGAPVILPGGHQPPEPGKEPVPDNAGEVSDETLAALLAYATLPAPAAGAEVALRIRIPAIGVDHPVVQGDDWEQLKLGVGQFIGSADPGEAGNVVLSAHNDIYGEIFRHLERLAPGNEIVLSTASRDYTYIVDDARILAPTEVWVMAPTERAQVTLISCFPYRINTHRIAIMAHLLESPN